MLIVSSHPIPIFIFQLFYFRFLLLFQSAISCRRTTLYSQRPIHFLRNRFPIPKTHSNHAILNCRSLVPSGCCHCRPCCYSSTPRWYVFLIHVQSDGGIKANTSFFRPDRPQRRLRPTSTSRGGCYDRCSRKRCSFRLCISQQGYVPSCPPPFLFYMPLTPAAAS